MVGEQERERVGEALVQGRNDVDGSSDVDGQSASKETLEDGSDDLGDVLF